MLSAQEPTVPQLQTPLTLSQVSSPEQAGRDAVHLQTPLWQSDPVVSPSQDAEVPHIQFPVEDSHVSPEGQVTEAHIITKNNNTY